MRIGTSELVMDMPFKLYADCIPVKGTFRSLICDLARNKYIFIPNDLFDIISKFEGRSLDYIITQYSKKNKKIILEYFEHLLNHEMVFFTDNVNLFPKLNIKLWDEPSITYQAVIDCYNSFDHINDNIIEDLCFLGCKYLQLRIYDEPDINSIREFLSKTDTSSILGIDIILKYSETYTLETLKILGNTFTRINNIYVFNAPNNKRLCESGVNSMSNIIYLKENITGHINCGVVSPSYFAPNIKSYSHSLNHNSCLDRKISIDAEGNIKNCPSMKESFGNIKNTTLKEALAKRGF